MTRHGHRALSGALLLTAHLATGCAFLVADRHLPPVPPFAPPVNATRDTIQQTAYTEPSENVRKTVPGAAGATPLPAPRPLTQERTNDTSNGPLFAGKGELAVDALVEAVLARNPTLAQKEAAWEAARARYPQAISLDDPFLQGGATPSLFGGQGLHGGWQATLSQKYPWPGKLQLRGERTRMEARAAANDIEDVRLRLIESARIAFYDYYLVYRALAINAEAIRLVKEFRRNAVARYRPAVQGAEQQDILLADVELGRTRERGLLLEQARQIALARLNTLLNQPPDVPLPRPPATIRVADGLPPVEKLRGLAVARRPELQALSNRIAAQEAALQLAFKEYCPDFELLASYNALWQPALQQPLLGVRMNLPVRLSRRAAAVWEARARIAQLRAELADQVNQVNFQVQQAYAQVEQGKKAVRLYEKSVLRAAELNVKSTQVAYITAKVPFLTLIEAEREVINLRDRYYELIAEYYRRLAALERAVGGVLVPGPEHQAPAPTSSP
jgi:cobalt-zinc-cadmium efflux system outer membrane protein